MKSDLARAYATARNPQSVAASSLGQALFEVFVFARRGGVVAKIVAKGQRSPLFSPAAFDDVHVVAVRPLSTPTIEWAERVVWVRNVDVSERLDQIAVHRHWLKRGD